MNKLKNYWERWCICYRENGFKYSVIKVFKRIGERHQRIMNEKKTTNVKSDAKLIFENNISLLNLSESKINVGFILTGGLGDFVVAANYVYKFQERFGTENLRVDIFSRNKNNCPKVIFYDNYVIDCLYVYSDYEKAINAYDVLIELRRYPDIKKRNDKKISQYIPELFEYIHLCERFRSENSRYFTNPGVTDGQSAALSIAIGKKRINQMDIYDFFKITEIYEYKIPIMEDEYDYLNDIDLNKDFITINRGIDTNATKESVKMWPFIYYNLLIKLIKSKYPDIVLVQLGPSHDRCETFQGIDLDMVGKTNLEQVKVLLKHALVHIDGEGGMVHLRHALKGGKSVVLFGPTSSKFFGYSENENVVGNGCATWCEWVTNDWQKSCIRGYGDAPCMLSITPERVMKSVEKIIEEERGNV